MLNAPNAIKYSKEVIDKELDVSLELGLEIEKQGESHSNLVPVTPIMTSGRSR